MSELSLSVVGGGLVGATAALMLARRFPARQILWLDRGELTAPPAAPTFNARVIACTPGSIEFFSRLGVWPQLPVGGYQNYRSMQVWDRQSKARIAFHAEEVGAERLGCIVPVGDLLRAILTEIEGCANLQRWAGASVVGLTAAEEGVRMLSLASGEQLACELVIAADGTHSTLRELAGIAARIRPMQQTALVAVVQHQLPHRDTAWQAFDRQGPLAFLPLPDDLQGLHQSAIVWSLDEPVAERYLRLSDEELIPLVAAAIDGQLGAVSALSARGSFPLQQLHARSYTQPGFCLIGDAAHTLHPLAGQGANLGIRDVHTLDGELQRAVRRAVSPGHLTVLRRYERARKLENLALLASMEAFRYGFGSSSALIGWLRQLAMRQVDARPGLKLRLARQAML